MRLRLFFTGVIAAALLIVSHQAGYLAMPESFLIQAFAPLTRSAGKLSTSFRSLGHAVADLKTLGSENERLRAELAAARERLAVLEETQKENELLRAQLGIPATRGKRLVLSAVLSRTLSAVDQVIIIDRGSADGIQKGQLVVTGGALVGRVESVSARTARVTLITHPDALFTGMVGENRADGLVRGELSVRVLTMEKIEQRFELKQGQTVILKGQPGSAEGLVIGYIDSVKKTSNELFQSARVRPAADLHALESVFVIAGE